MNLIKVVKLGTDSASTCDCDLVDANQLKMEEKKIEARMKELEELEKQLKEHEESVTRKKEEYESEVKRRELSLQSWESELEEREAEIERKYKESEDVIVARVQRLDRAAERYAAERKLWEEIANDKKESPANYEAEFRGISERFRSMCDILNDTRRELAEARSAVCNSFDDGILKLCKLYREMCFTRESRLEEMAGALGIILMSEFGVSPIEPEPGSEYCSELHEKLDFNKKGDIVASCCVRGWSYKDKTLLRAVVDTKEGGNW